MILFSDTLMEDLDTGEFVPGRKRWDDPGRLANVLLVQAKSQGGIISRLQGHERSGVVAEQHHPTPDTRLRGGLVRCSRSRPYSNNSSLACQHQGETKATSREYLTS